MEWGAILEPGREGGREGVSKEGREGEGVRFSAIIIVYITGMAAIELPNNHRGS